MIAKEEKNLEFVKKSEGFKREKIKEESATDEQRSISILERIAAEAKAELEKLQNEEAQQKSMNKINDETIAREKKVKEQILAASSNTWLDRSSYFITNGFNVRNPC